MSDIYLSITETPTVVTLTNPLISSNVAQSVTITNVVSVNVVTMPAINVTAAAPAVTTVAGTVSISNFPSTQTIAGTVTANVANSVTVGSVAYIPPAVQSEIPFLKVNLIWPNSYSNENNFSGYLKKVTKPFLNGFFPEYYDGWYDHYIKNYDIGGGDEFPTLFIFDEPKFYADLSDGANANAPYGNPWKYLTGVSAGSVVPSSVLTVTAENPFTQPISGTVTVGNSVTIGSLPAISGTVTIGAIGGSVTIPVRLFAEAESGPSSGQDTLLQCNSSGSLNVALPSSGGTNSIAYDGTYSFVQVKQVSSVTVGAMPSGALTTRFGSVTTANTSQLTSCVTNSSRKYLLAQNISAGTVTIGIGFSPTTTQGIQLTAGAGLTFDTFCPTGAVYWLGAVTGAAFTILEG